MAKFTGPERTLAKSIVATLSIKRIPDTEIIKEIYDKTNKMITRMSLYNLRQQIKKESFQFFMFYVIKTLFSDFLRSK